MALVIGQIKIGNLWRSQTEILNLISSHIHRYPQMEIIDTYKLLYQGAMGPEHALDDTDRFIQQLDQEFEAAGMNENIPLWENLRPDGEIVRLNIGPYKSRGGTAGQLSTLFLWTASSFNGNINDLKESWMTLNKLCRDGRVRKFDREKLDRFNVWLNQHNYPPVHHSKNYTSTYHPAYRLIRREFLGILQIR